MADHFADVAQQRQQQFRKLPGALPHESANLSVGSNFRGRNGRWKNSGEAQRAGRADGSLPSAFSLCPFAPVAQSSERRASNAKVAGESPAGSTNRAALAQLPEALRSERRGWGWNSLTRHQCSPCASSPRSPMQRRSAQDGKVAGASPATRTISGMSTGQARRTCLLNSELLEKGVWCESTAFRHFSADAAR
jgi:hypothetical protein